MGIFVIGGLVLFGFAVYSLSSFINCQDEKRDYTPLPEIPGMKFVKNVLSLPFISIIKLMDYFMPIDVTPLPPKHQHWHDAKRKEFKIWRQEEEDKFWRDKP